MYAGEYGGILLGLGLCLVLAIVFAGLSYVVSAKAADVEKVSAYECGFDPFDDTRKTFDVRFYLVAILFIIFLKFHIRPKRLQPKHLSFPPQEQLEF